MENPVMILGANGIGKVAMDIFTSRNILIYCFLDEDEALHGTEIQEVSVMGSYHDDGYLKYIGKKCEAFVAVEASEKRRELVKMLKERRKVMPVNAIHDRAIVSQHAFIGYGNFINAGAVVQIDAKVTNHCFVQANAVIDYEAELGEFVQIGHGAVVGARAKLAEGVLVGAGAIIAPGVKIGKDAQIGPGTLVLQDVEEEAIVFGLPGKVV